MGEPLVWLTAMGLAVGLSMIIGLLGLIFVNGTRVFWPKPVALITFKEEGQTRYRGGLTVSGVILSQQEMDMRDLTREQIEDPDEGSRQEKYVFIGNRDVYGESFAYFNVGDIDRIEYPDQLLRAERMEWGDAFLVPRHLQLEDGRLVEAGNPEFTATLDRLMEEVADRRSEINRIDRGQIGSINQRMRKYELAERFLSRLESPTPSEQRELAEARANLEQLRAEYEPLARNTEALREKQNVNSLHFTLPTGEMRSQPLGDFVHHYWPNQLGLLQKVRLFLFKIWDFLSGYPREANTEGGIFPAIFGTFVMTLLMSFAVTPFGVLAAIYLREYAKQGPMVRAVRIAINNLAGVPSIVFGIFGLGFFVYFVGGSIDRTFYPRSVELGTPTFGTGGILWASLTLALMTVPVVIVATEEAIASVSRGVREGSLACGASKWQTIQRLVLPASAPGILTGLILAMARGAGEVAPLMLVGVVALAPNLPIDGQFPFIHTERKFMHLGFHIYDLGFQSPDSEAAQPMVFATTLILILLVIALNLGAILIRNHLRKKYLSSAF